jgi:alkylated DNA repair dioxygenase AlkB
MTSTLTFQGSLLDLTGAAPSVDRAFSDIRRFRFPDGAWVDRMPGWVVAADQLFTTAVDALDWREGTERIRGVDVPRPRLVATPNRNRLPAGLEVFADMSDALSHRYGLRLDRISCNLYRDGHDSVAWHGDRVARDRSQAIVAVVSLGEPRPFRLRPRGGGSSVSWPSGRGDLVVMGGSCQRTCEHSVPKVASAGPRIAIMFREPNAPAGVRRRAGR